MTLGQRLATRLGPFRHRPFLVYWGGGLTSNLGTWLQAVAGSVFVYQLTGSALAVGVLNFVGFLPILLFSVAGGVISDRFDRRRIVVAGHVISGTIAAILAVLAFAGVAREIHVIVAAFALNTIYAITKPAIVSLLPALVPREDLTEAVGLNALQFIFGQMIGPTMAALVIATSGVEWAFAINAVTYLGPIVSMAYLYATDLGGRAGPERRRSRGAAAPPGGSIAYLRGERWILALLLGVVACSAPLEVIRTLSPALVVEGLGEPESSAGLIVAAQSAGSALALLVFVPIRRRGRSREAAAVGLLVQAVGLAMTGLAPNLGVASIAVGLVGFGFSLSFPVLTGAVQAEVPDEVRGRVMAFHQMSHLGNRPFVALAIGALATMFSAQVAVVAGVLLAPLGLVATRIAWRRLRDHDPKAAQAGPALETTPIAE